MNPQYEIKDMISAILKKWKLVVSLALIFAFVALIYSCFIATPVYKAEGSIYVNSVSAVSDTSNISINTINASQKLANTCIEVLKSNSFLHRVVKRLDAPISSSALASSLTIKAANETELLEISVKHPDPKMACKLTNTILEMSKDEVVRVIKAGSVEIVDEAGVPKKPVSPNTTNNIAIGFIFGLILGGAMAFLLEILNTKITGRDDLTKYYDAVVLGSVPTLRDKRQEGAYAKNK